MSANAEKWAWEQSPQTTSQKLVLMALADRADEDGELFPSNDWIATKCAPMSERTVRRNISELVEQGLVVKVERNRRQDGTLSTWTLRLALDRPAATSGHVRPVDEEQPAATGGRADLDLPDGSSEADASESPSGVDQAMAAIIATWQSNAPPLIQHRDQSLQTRALRALLARKLTVYDWADICAAIANYATVLGGSDYRWSHSWTITDFLNRGLDRFVPEARPLENFRIRSSGEKFGRRDVSASEMLALADKLDQRKEIESGTG